LTQYAPRGIRDQGRPQKRFLEEWDRNRTAMDYFPESEKMMMMVVMVMVVVIE
jgi:2-keto-3-deoxy-L-rhamnonate aldolase RhmA